MKTLLPRLLARRRCSPRLSAARALAAQALQPLDRIAAVVDEDVILQSELDRAVANILAQYAGRQASCRRATCWSARCWSAWCW